MTRLKASVATTAVLLLGALSACGGGEAAAPSAAGASTQPGVVKDIASLVPKDVATGGTLKVGTGAASPPEGFKTATGELDGYEIKLMEEVGKTLGLKVQWEVTDFASLIPGLQSNRFSLGTGQMGITAERAKVVDFVTLVLTNQAFAAKKSSGLSNVTINDLCGKRVAVNQGSRQQEFGTKQSQVCKDQGKPAVDLNVFQNTNDAWLSMQSGRTDIYWSGSTGVGYLVGTVNDAQIVGNYLEPYPTGIALSKGSKLGPAVEKAMQHLIDDGTYQQILDKWGLKDNAIKKAELNPKITW